MVYVREQARPRWKAAQIVEFCGWDFLSKMISLASDAETKRLIAGAFLTGGRIQEVLSLERTHFDFTIDPDMVVVRAMPILKRYEKVRITDKWRCVEHCKMRWNSEPTQAETAKHRIEKYAGWETKPTRGYRTFPFPKREPLVATLRETMQGAEGKLFDMKYSTAYKKTVEIGEQLGTWIPTHWFRAQRASQLALEYGFGEHELIEWFGWKDYMTAFIYARKGYKGLAVKMS